MNTPIAIAIAAFVLACLALDALVFGGFGAFFLARKTADLIEWLAFWR